MSISSLAFCRSRSTEEDSDGGWHYFFSPVDRLPAALRAAQGGRILCQLRAAGLARGEVELAVSAETGDPATETVYEIVN